MKESDWRTGSDKEHVWFSLAGERHVLTQQEALGLAAALQREANVVYTCAACHYPHGSLSPAGLGRRCPGCGRKGYATGTFETRGHAAAQHLEWKERRDRAETERTEAFRMVFA